MNNAGGNSFAIYSSRDKFHGKMFRSERRGWEFAERKLTNSLFILYYYLQVA